MKIVKRILLIQLLLICTSPLFGQSPAIQWQKTYGGTGLDGASSIQQTRDGGFIIGGYSTSSDGDATLNRGDLDCWVIKIDSSGSIMWQKSYGGSLGDAISQIIEDVNGGYIFVGNTSSNDWDITGNHGNTDGLVVKMDGTGHIIWQKVMGSSGFDYFSAVKNTFDSGYIIVGGAGANNGDISGWHSTSSLFAYDVWVLKLSKSGFVEMNKVFGGTNRDCGFDIIQTKDSGYIVAGKTNSIDGDVNVNKGIDDIWLIKLSDTGKIEWAKTYGGSHVEQANNVIQLANNRYLFACWTTSNDSDVIGNHGGFDYWLVCVDSAGTMLWNKCYGGAGYEIQSSFSSTNDGGAILVGYTNDLNGEVTSSHGAIGSLDFWVVKVDDSGGIKWETCFGGSNIDSGFTVIQTIDSGYAIAGNTLSNDGDITSNHGSGDIWFAKLHSDPTNSIQTIISKSIVQVYPTITNGIVNIVFPTNNYQNSKILVTDIFGNKVYEQVGFANNLFSISLTNFMPGIYVLQVLSDNSVTTNKIIYNP